MWNFISWTAIIGVIFLIFESDRIPEIKKNFNNFYKKLNKKKKK